MDGSMNTNEKKLEAMMEDRWAYEQGHEPGLALRQITLELMDQRDELLAALEGMEKWASSIHDGYPPSTASIAAAPYREAARAAIAKVKGGAT
jgi:hypothetical protein